MMRKYLERIFGGSCQDFYRLAEKDLLEHKKNFIITANPEILMKSRDNSEISQMLLSDEVTVVPDGISVVKAMEKVGLPVTERITGVDLAEQLLKFSGENNLSVYLFGASQQAVTTLADKLRRKYPKAVFNFHNGYDGDKDEIFKEIVELSPDLILVAMGVPAQELLIDKHYDSFQKGVFIGVGGSFDVLSGLKKRAPSFFVNTNTEWLYRIICEPSRIKRFYDNNIKFLRQIK